MRPLPGSRFVAVVGLLLTLAGCAHPAPPVQQVQAPPAPPPPPDLNALYERAIKDAAVKSPAFIVDLTPIKAKGEIELVSLHREEHPPVNPKSQVIPEAVWVALPDELAAKCRTRHGDPLLALEQILGLPPVQGQDSGSWELSMITVPVRRVFRPCASSPDVTSTRCSLEIARANGSQADFVYHQMWSSYETGGDRPGYPFTGMGWTYDWGPDNAGSHYGVSEYVIRPGTRAGKVEDLTPQEFCQATDGSADGGSSVVTPASTPAAAGARHTR